MRPNVILLVTLMLCLALASGEEPRQILIINAQTGEPYDSARIALIQELDRIGYSEADGTLQIRTYSLGNNMEFMKRIQTLEGDTISKYDAILLNGTIALLAAKELWYGRADLDFLFFNITDPLGSGVIDGFSKPPKANFSGISYPVPVRERLRFLRRILPAARRIGYLYADMPQSWSYNRWLEEALAEAEFRDLELVMRKIDFVAGENGSIRMAIVAAEQAALLNDEVDVFLAPNDQMGINFEFSRRISRLVNKPIVALGYQEIADHSGALMSIYPDTTEVGRRMAGMVQSLFNGASIQDVYPEQPPYDYILDKNQVQRFGIVVPPEYSEKLQ